MAIDYPLELAPETTWMAVDAAWRRRGLGRALMGHVAGELTAEGAAAVLSVLTHAASVPERALTPMPGPVRSIGALDFCSIRHIHPPGWSNPASLLAAPLSKGRHGPV